MRCVVDAGKRALGSPVICILSQDARINRLRKSPSAVERVIPAVPRRKAERRNAVIDLLGMTAKVAVPLTVGDASYRGTATPS